MLSHNIVFTGKDQVEFVKEPVRDPGSGEVMLKARKTLISTGLCILGAHDSNPPAQSMDHAYWSHQRMADLFYTYVLRGDMRVTDLITHRYSPADAPEAYRMLREERATAMGALFDWAQW